MPTTIKMRVTRVSEYDSGGSNIREVQLVTNDRDNVALNAVEELAYANLTASFVAPNGDDLEHDSLVDVVLTVSAATKKGK